MRAMERVHAFIDLGGDGIEYCCTVVATSGVAGSFLALETVFYDQRSASSKKIKQKKKKKKKEKKKQKPTKKTRKNNKETQPQNNQTCCIPRTPIHDG